MDYPPLPEDRPANERSNRPGVVRRLDQATRSIDLRTVFAQAITTSGSYDLRRAKLAPFEQFLQALSVPTLLVAPSHVVLFANDAFTTMTDPPLIPEQLTFASLFGTPREARDGQLLLEQVFDQRKATERETDLQIAGKRMWARIHLRTIRLAEDRLVLVQIENLTAQKELLAASKYKKLVTIFPIGIAEFALKRPLPCTAPILESIGALLGARMVDGNNEFANVYKQRQVRRLLGITMEKLFPCRGRARAVYEEWIQDGFPIFSFESKARLRNDEKAYFEDTLIGTIDHGCLVGFWWLKKDVSEKRRLEEDVIKGQKLESLGVLAGGIAHDFNNLLTAILGNISLAKLHVDSGGKAYERIQAASKAASRAQGLTRQLLTFSKGGQPVKRVGSISDLLKECTTFVLRGSNVASEFQIPTDLWCVEMDEAQISQVINNVVINAAQAMPDGGIVRLRAENVFVREGNRLSLGKGRYVRVSIVDSGLGIPRDQIPKVFDPYFTTKQKGTGLGLATAYSIIRKHDGLITVDSKPGRGTTFHFLLPAAIEKASAQSSLVDKVCQGKGRILVMDDEETIRDLAFELLTSSGFEVCLAKDGTEALAIYRQAIEASRTFDAVIMDLTIPGGMGGKETVRHLLAIDPGATVIVSSGYFNDPIMSDYASFGFKGVLPKPYDVNQLTAVLERSLRGDAASGPG